ncbi:MAG: trypsin-like peptidase domain-containing protein [Bacteroidales bacterium]|nr:trypsin-like peptidase domain-containing protein [Bacteroidales bacterium]
MMKGRNIIGMLLIAMLGSILGIAIYASFVKPKTVVVQSSAPTPVVNTRLLPSGVPEADFRMAAEKAVHAVVHVKTISTVKGYRYETPFDWFFGEPRSYRQQQTGFGSGVIISPDGYIVTNNHVIDGSDEIEVTLNDSRVIKAELVGKDPQTDVAVIRIKEKNLQYLEFGNSNELQVGDWVLAVGNPFDLQSTVTAGIVSAKGRGLDIIGNNRNPYRSQQEQSRIKEGIESFIQTDAAVNPGNSGGALVNLRGELVGINTAIASQTGVYMGYSFAVPVSIAKKVVDDLIEFGEVQRAGLGIIGGTVTAKEAETNNLKVNQGVLVTDLTKGGGAQAAGLKTGDVIVAVDDHRITSMAELQEQIGQHRAGDQVIVVVNRNGNERQFKVALKPLDTNAPTLGASETWDYLGVELEELSEKELQKINQLSDKLTFRSAVRVVKIKDGKFKSAGVPEGFIITHINRAEVAQPEDVVQLINRINGGVFIEGVTANGRYDYYTFKK